MPSAPMQPVSLAATGLALSAGGAPGARRLVEALSFRVQPGERWLVIGPNGAGKSSLLAALAGVFPLGAGTIRIDDRPLADWPAAALARRRAWSPQFWSDPFPATVLETVALARPGAAGWRAVLADPHDDADLLVVLERLDLGALARVDVQALSGGERQRVALATALAQGAPLLLLDEPASHLDPAHQRLLVEALLRHGAEGGTVIASVHDFNLAWDLATHVVLLDGRGGARAGTRDELLQSDLLGTLFGVAVEAVEVAGARRFFFANRSASRV